MADNENNLGNEAKRLISGFVKKRIENIGDAAKQSIADVGKNVTTSVRTGLGLANDENTSHLATDSDPDAPVYEVMAESDGKNARVRLWPDRLEWEKGRGISGGKVLAATLTMGASALITGIRGGKDGFETLPLSAITNISLQKSGMSHQLVSVQTAGGTIDFRVSRYNAADFRLAILSQMQRNASAPAKVEVISLPDQAAPAPSDFSDQLQKLASLRDSGILSEEEFQAKKSEILGRL